MQVLLITFAMVQATIVSFLDSSLPHTESIYYNQNSPLKTKIRSHDSSEGSHLTQG